MKVISIRLKKIYAIKKILYNTMNIYDDDDDKVCASTG